MVSDCYIATMDANSREELELEPLRPQESDCCGSGCDPCILDIYQQDLDIFRKKKTEKAPHSKLGTESYLEFELLKTISVTRTTNIYRFKLPPGQILGHKAGQHLIVREVHPKNPQLSITRQYSILSQPSVVDWFELLIKLYPDGLMSSVISKWTAGTKVWLRGPFGSFKHDRQRQKRLLFICQGTGLVPILSVIREILDDEEDETNLRLLYSVRCYDEILMKSDLYDFCDYWNFSMKIFVKQDPELNKLQGPNKEMICDRISLAHIKSEMMVDTYTITCGSKEYMNSVCDNLQLLHVNKENIFRFYSLSFQHSEKKQNFKKNI